MSVNIGRFRWTDEEKHEVFDQLAQSLKPKEQLIVGLVPVADTVEEAKTRLLEGDQINGLSTGYEDLDLMTRGMAPGEMIVLFGDTSHGKSQLSQNITLNVALEGHKVLFVGLEMTNTENTLRFLQMLGDANELMKLPIIYPKSSTVTYQDIDGLVKKGKEEGAELVVIDHLHMLTRNIENMANELSLICHEIKRVARSYEVPIILISHINRTGADKGVPKLSHLKGSGSIEQDADMAIAVFRDIDKNSQTLSVVLRKNRNRGMKHKDCELNIEPSQRLVSQIEKF